MAENQVQYNHQQRKSDEPSDAAATATIHATPKAEVEATDRGLFGFVGKKKEEKKCDGEGKVIASEFDEKVKVSEEKKEESKEHGGLLQKLRRSTSSSSSVSSLCYSYTSHVLVTCIRLSRRYQIMIYA